jgi:tetratricopeptide (TPR) repeat protein
MAQDSETAASTAADSSLVGLGEVEKRVLSYAAAIGKEFEFSVLASAMEMDEETLAESLERLVHSGILKELNWGDSYTFVRMGTLAQAYRDISSSRLRVIHKKIAEAYEKRYPDPPPNIIPEMGRHFFLGKIHDKSLLYNRYAAKLAIDAFSPTVAIRHMERAQEDLASLPGDHRVEEADVLKEIGQQYVALGEDERADSIYQECLKKLPEEEVTLRALLLLARANVAREIDKLWLTSQLCEEAIRLLEKAGHKKGLALAHRTLSRTANRAGQYEVGRKEIEAAIALLTPGEDDGEIAICYIDLGNIVSEISSERDPGKALEIYKKAIQVLESLHDYNELARALNNYALALMPDRPQEALEGIMKARAVSKMAEDRRGLGWWLFNSVEIRLALGQVEEAIRDNEEAGKILTLLNDAFGIQQVALNQGIIAQHRKSFEESERAYMESAKRAEKLGYSVVLVEVLVHSAMMYAEWGKKEEAAREISRIQKLGEDKVYTSLKSTYDRLKEQVGLPAP